MPSLTASPSGGGGVPTFFVAAADASDESKSLANYVCSGSGDHVEIQAAIDALPNGAGRVTLSEGWFYLGAGLTLSYGAHLAGLGMDATYLDSWGFPAITTGGGSSVSGFTAFAETGVLLNGYDDRVEDCKFENCDVGVELSSSSLRCWVRRCVIYNADSWGVDASAGGGEMCVRECIMQFCGTSSSGGGVSIGSGAAEVMVLDNRFKDNVKAVVIASGASSAALAGNFMHNGGVADVTDASASTQYGTNFSLSGAW